MNSSKLRFLQLLTGLPFGLFETVCQKKKWLGHLTIFGLFWMLNNIFLGLFSQNLSKSCNNLLNITLNLVISSYFNKFLRKIRPFLIFKNLTFFETAYGQIWPFKFFWTWQPWLLIQRMEGGQRLTMPHVWPYFFPCAAEIFGEKIKKHFCLLPPPPLHCNISTSKH